MEHQKRAPQVPLTPEQQEEEIRRTRLPREGQHIGVIEQRLGGSRLRVKCMDGKVRVCRIPGRVKRTLWVREGDVVLVEPWEFGGDEKGDVVFKYRSLQVGFLKRKGLLKTMDEEEF